MLKKTNFQRITVLISLIFISSFVACNSPQPDIFSSEQMSTSSSSMALSKDEKTLWVVNPDADTVTEVNLEKMIAAEPVLVGKEPWSIAISPHSVVVVNRASGSISLLKGSKRTDLYIGAEPASVVLSHEGNYAYVSVSSESRIAVIDLAQLSIVKNIAVARTPWALAIRYSQDSPDGQETLIVTHRSAQLKNGKTEGQNDAKEGLISVISQPLNAAEVKQVAISPYDFGFANVLEGIAIHNDTAFITHMLNSPDEPRAAFHTVSGAVSAVSISKATELKSQGIDTNDADFSTPVNFPNAIAFSSDGTKAYVVLGGTNAVMGIDYVNPEAARLIGFWAVGNNPRGIVLSADGTKAYVMNYLSRDISILDITDTVRRPEIARISVTKETLSEEMLRGKILFHNANDPRISTLGWMSCASCHIDGGVDGTSWGTPEGLRQTMPLWNLAGTEPLHISGTRDEVQDFEHDIERFMGGVGLASGAANILLGDSSKGQSTDLDALAAFVLNGIRVPNAPRVDSDDAILVETGRNLFNESGCTSCHVGQAWTKSQLPAEAGSLIGVDSEQVIAVLQDVGTYNPTTDIFGSDGFDIPTLLGIHATALYLHDGSAKTLEDVLGNATHTKYVFSEEEINNITYFLKSIDSSTDIFEGTQ